MNLHIELTNRCVLSCPGCPRTQWQELLKMPVSKSDLDIDDFARFLDCPGGDKISTFTLCGDYGDSIYYPKLFEFLNRFRATKSYNLTTNGSHRSDKFWHELSEILDERDTVCFSIDGLEDTNHIYRVNSNWSDIMRGLDIMSKSRSKIVWKSIIFNYNYHQLAEMKKIANDKGCEFTAEKTHRYGNEQLRPPDHLVELNYEYQEIFQTDHSIVIEPRCVKEKVITCEGFLFPCDWIRNPKTLYKSQLWKQKNRWIEKLNIKNTNFDQAMLIVEDWSNFVRQSSQDQLPTVDVLCKMKCRQGCRQNRFVEIS